MLEQTDILRIQNLTNDISKLQEFIDALATFKGKKITSLYIVFEKSTQIEFKGNFSEQSTEKLLNLILESRENLKSKLNKALEQCMELTKL